MQYNLFHYGKIFNEGNINMELLNRKIKKRINFNQIEDDIKSIIVTSSDYNTQTNKTTLELVKRLTRRNKKVLLINADINKEMNILPYEKMVNRKRLQIVDYKEIIDNDFSILGRTTMKEFINRSKESYDYVILDAPGIGVNNDVMVLSNFVDKTVLVQGNDLDSIKEANSKLNIIGSNVLRVK